MSVSMAGQAVIERRKTVTRRKGWTFLRPGDRLTLCRKVRGRKPGEPLVRLAEVEVVNVRREPLRALLGTQPFGPITDYARAEMSAEGFPGMHPLDFIDTYFVVAQVIAAYDYVTRIEWCYLPGVGPTRPSTDIAHHPDGSSTIKVHRCCNGCGRDLGDATDAEVACAIGGARLPDVRDECGCGGPS